MSGRGQALAGWPVHCLSSRPPHAEEAKEDLQGGGAGGQLRGQDEPHQPVRLPGAGSSAPPGGTPPRCVVVSEVGAKGSGGKFSMRYMATIGVLCDLGAPPPLSECGRAEWREWARKVASKLSINQLLHWYPAPGVHLGCNIKISPG